MRLKHFDLIWGIFKTTFPSKKYTIMMLRLLLVVSVIVLGGAFAGAYIPTEDPGDDEKERERLI